jgi:hypothetical protein
MTTTTKPPSKGNSGNYPIKIAGDNLKFSQLAFDDQHVVAEEILRKGGFNPTIEHRLVELTYPGTKSWDDDEKISLDTDKPRCFIVGKSDRLFTFSIDDIAYEVPFEKLDESQLREIAKVKDDMTLVLSQDKTSDKELGKGESVSFEGKEVERLYCRERKAVEDKKAVKDQTVKIHLDDKDEHKVSRGTYVFEKLVALFGIPTGYVLSYVNVEGVLTPFKGGEIEIFAGMKFFSHAPGGGAS